MIRIAFAGAGNIARVHARALAGPVAAGTAALVAATDTDAGALARFAPALGIAGTYPSLAHLLEGEQVDLVHPFSPPMPAAPCRWSPPSTPRPSPAGRSPRRTSRRARRSTPQ